jgi:signal transduction histidine kinase
VGRAAWIDRAVPVLLGLALFSLSLWAESPPPILGKTYHGPPILPAIACAIAATAARRRTWPLYLTALPAWWFYGMWPAIMAASYYAATARNRARLAAYAAIAGAGVLVPDVIGTALFAHDVLGDLLSTAAAAVLLVGLPVLAGLWVTAHRDVLAGLRERAARLEAEQAARTAQARTEERARIAREMHDVLAHQVSLIVLHAGALEVNAPDQATAESAELIRTTGRQALTELRQVLGMLHPGNGHLEPQPTLADLDRLLDRSRTAGIPIDRHDEGRPRPLPATTQRTAYRVIQEALTNVGKHAGSADTSVTLRYRSQAVEVTVRNTAPPRPADRTAPGSGLGLAGLRERVALLGGRFTADHDHDGGFTVHATLPAPTGTEPG